MKAVAWIVICGSVVYLAVQLVVAGAQIALHQARKHGAGDWDCSGKWHWRGR